jgi:hypothetical protein
MFESVRRQFGAPDSCFAGVLDAGGGWVLGLESVLGVLRQSASAGQPLVVLGTAFNFVHLLDHLAQERLRFPLAAGSRVLETGGYKGRSRAIAKTELQALITDYLAIPPSHIVSEYGMSELSSQAYDHVAGGRQPGEIAGSDAVRARPPSDPGARIYTFPPWARVLVVSPETGREVGEGERGLLRVLDLANVWSVMAVQTEDLGARRGAGFALLGRAGGAEPRGCSLLAP